MKKVTEQDSLYHNLENESVENILTFINQEDLKVAKAVQKCLPTLGKLINHTFPKMAQGGRLFYIGAGTSGRLGILDASECPPTFGVDFNTVIGIIAGGDQAIRKAVENAEDDQQQAMLDLASHHITSLDTVVGIAASGTTPYVVSGLRACQEKNITTACITSNKETPLAKYADFPIEVHLGPEFITGSSRMKSGTAQKMILNMLSTALMVKLGKVKGNKMVDMQLSNDKLIDRGTKMIQNALHLSYDEAQHLLLKHGSVRAVLNLKS